MTEQEYIKKLEQEKAALENELQRIQKKKEKRKSVGYWILRKSSVPLIGIRLKKSISNAIQEYKATRTLSVDTVSDVSSNIIWRVTRIGIFAFFISLLPSIFIAFQTFLVFRQNDLIKNQTVAVEAARRSSYVFVMGDALSDLNEELKYKGENSKRNISTTLESRIAILSKALKPYRYLDNEELIDEPISPERGQLLYSLIMSDLGEQSFRDISNAGEFSYSFLQDAVFGYNKNFKYIRLNHSDLSRAYLPSANLEGSELVDAVMVNTTLSESNLKQADLTRADLSNAELLSADLTYAKLNKANLVSADLTEAILWGTEFNEANLKDAVLDNAIVHRSDWFNFLSDSLQVKGIDDLTDKYRIQKQGTKQFIIKNRKN